MTGLRQRLIEIPDLESRIHELRIYLQAKKKKLTAEYLAGKTDLQSLFFKLTDLADGVLQATYEMAREEIKRLYGEPQCRDVPTEASDFSVVGMGKLGGRELHFNSDLDILFIFSKHGDSTGPRRLTNQEYFAKVAQRMISYLTLSTKHGYAYRIDTELRPSGNQGTLVSPLDAWVSYYQEHAALWERQALLKARLVFATGHFAEQFKGLFPKLIYLQSLPQDMAAEIDRLRQRIEKELAKESENKYHYKKGRGGLLEIEFTVQYLQLKFGQGHPEILDPNTLLALDRLLAIEAISPANQRVLKAAYLFYRRLEIILEIEFDLKEGYLDLNHEVVQDLATKMSFPEAKALIEEFRHYREKVRGIYLKILNL